jgi:predicted dehydrogenase
MYRFHPQIIWALQQIHAGRLGTIRQVRATLAVKIPLLSHDIRLQANLGGGSLMDIGCYALNFCRAVYGRSPLAVAAQVYTAALGEVEHTTSAILDFGEGRFAQIDSTFLLPTYQVAEVMGEEGRLTIPQPFMTDVYETEVILALEGQTIHQKISAVDACRLELEHFGACIRSGAPPAFSLVETLDNLATLEAIYQVAGYQVAGSA